MSDFANYRDGPTRTAMIAFVSSSRSISAQYAERELQSLNHVGLAYVYRDMVAAESASRVAIADYDPLAVGRV